MSTITVATAAVVAECPDGKEFGSLEDETPPEPRWFTWSSIMYGLGMWNAIFSTLVMTNIKRMAAAISLTSP